MAPSNRLTRNYLPRILALILTGSLAACGSARQGTAPTDTAITPNNKKWMEQNMAGGPQGRLIQEEPSAMNQRGKVMIPDNSSFESSNRYSHERGAIDPMAPDNNGDTATLVTKDSQGNTRIIQPGRKKLFCFEGPDGETCVYSQLPTLRFGMEQRGIQVPSLNTSTKAGRTGHNYSPDRLESPNWW